MILKIAQVQDFSRGIPVFRVPVRIGIVAPAGRTTRTVWVQGKEETFELPAGAKPLFVRFDEGNVLIKELAFPKEREELFYGLGNDDVIGRIWAAGELTRLKSDPTVIERLNASAVEALAATGDKRAAAVLRKAALDANSSVRAAAVRALGGLEDRSLSDFFKDRFRKEASDLVKAEAVRALGLTADAADASFLEEAASCPAHRDMVGREAEAVLKRLRERKGTDRGLT